MDCVIHNGLVTANGCSARWWRRCQIVVPKECSRLNKCSLEENMLMECVYCIKTLEARQWSDRSILLLLLTGIHLFLNGMMGKEIYADMMVKSLDDQGLKIGLLNINEEDQTLKMNTMRPLRKTLMIFFMMLPNWAFLSLFIWSVHKKIYKFVNILSNKSHTN